MDSSNRALQIYRPVKRDWEYILEDALEVSCFLSRAERFLLMEELRRQGTQASTIEIHPAFSFAKRALLVLQGQAIEECWVYNPKEKRIVKYLILRA